MDEEGDLNVAMKEFLSSCELLQQVLQDVDAEERQQEQDADSRKTAESMQMELAEYLAAETALMEDVKLRLQSSFIPCEASCVKDGEVKLTEAQRDLYMLRRSLVPSEVALLDAQISLAEAQSADPACLCVDAEVASEGDVDFAETILQQQTETLQRLLEELEKVESLQVLHADYERKRFELETQNRALEQTVETLISQCARVVMLSAMCESAESHARGLAKVLSGVAADAADALDNFQKRHDEFMLISGEADEGADAPATESDAAFLRAVAHMCVSAAKASAIELPQEEVTCVDERAIAGSKQLDTVKDVIARWIRVLRSCANSQKADQQKLLQRLLQRAGVSLPLSESTSADGATVLNPDADVQELEKLHSMAKDLSNEIHTLRTQVTDILSRERHDELFCTKRRLWEYFLREPDKLTALFPSSSDLE